MITKPTVKEVRHAQLERLERELVARMRFQRSEVQRVLDREEFEEWEYVWHVHRLVSLARTFRSVVRRLGSSHFLFAEGDLIHLNEVAQGIAWANAA